MPDTVKEISVDLNSKKKEFHHFFRATGYANADFTYTPAIMRMYEYISSYKNHPKYMRLHNIMTLHGKGDYYRFAFGCDYGNPNDNDSLSDVDVVVRRNSEGHLEYDWHYVDKVYDIIINHNMKPIVEMVYMPTCLAKNSEEACIPSNYREYAEAISSFIKHWIERYGIDEVRSWYFEVANEPENRKVIRERPEYFLALYDYFESAIHSIDPDLKVGGPAVKQWEDGKMIFSLFLKHCSSGVNYATGEYGTRIDFISVHCKAGHPSLVGPQMDYMFEPIRDYARILEQYPEFKGIPFFNDESDIVWDGNRGIEYKSWLNFRNTEYATGFICKMVNTYVDIVEDELSLNLAIVDSDNCHLLWERSLFSGNRSQLTPIGEAPSTDLIRKGFFNAGQLLGRLGDIRYIVKSEDEAFGIKYGCLATAFSDGSGYSLMLWNFEDGLDNSANDRTLRLKVSGFNGSAYRIIKYRIDRNHSTVYGIWEKRGKPYPLTPELASELRMNDSIQADENITEFNNSVLDISENMPMHSVVLILVVKEQPATIPEIQVAEISDDAFGHCQVFLKWKYASNNDFIGYNVYRNGKKINTRLISGSCLSDSDIEAGYSYEYQIETISAYSQVVGPIKLVSIE